MSSVLQDVHHLNNLTQALLEFAKASGSMGGIPLEPVRIDEVVMRIPGDMAKTNIDCAVKLEFDAMPDDEQKLVVFGNAELLFTAIKNIVSNACKYSTDHTAHINLSVTAREIIIRIEDHGNGIAEAELPHIFQPFYRAGDNRQVTGFGLGLPLAGRIIKLHKGDIGVVSTPGKGSVFTIHLPVSI
jgi:signal transduction histidine kinase